MTSDNIREQAEKYLDYIMRNGNASLWFHGKDFTRDDAVAIRREAKAISRARALLTGARMKGAGATLPYDANNIGQAGMSAIASSGRK